MLRLSRIQNDAADYYEFCLYKKGNPSVCLREDDPDEDDEADGTFDVNINTLVADENTPYILRISTYSDELCESKPDSIEFFIWPLPTINSLTATDVCEGENKVYVPFTASDNAQTIRYTLSGAGITDRVVDNATVVDGTIEVDIDGLTTGDDPMKALTLTVTAKSDHDCESAAPHKTTYRTSLFPVLRIV